MNWKVKEGSVFIVDPSMQLSVRIGFEERARRVNPIIAVVRLAIVCLE